MYVDVDVKRGMLLEGIGGTVDVKVVWKKDVEWSRVEYSVSGVGE